MTPRRESAPGLARPEAAPGLARLERWLLEVVTHPGGAASGLDSPAARELFALSRETLDDLVLPSRSLSALERVEVYASQYFARLREVLEEDFPTTRVVLGEESFREVSNAFLVAHPPSHYSLSKLGEGFASYLADEAPEPLSHRAFGSEVARLERAIDEVFDAPAMPPVELAELLSIPEASWPGARFLLVPSLRLLALDHPVNDFFQACRERRRADVPAPRATWLAVYRRDLTSWRLALEEPQFRILSALSGGGTLVEALESCADLAESELDGLASSLRDWFQDWTGLGFFATIEFD